MTRGLRERRRVLGLLPKPDFPAATASKLAAMDPEALSSVVLDPGQPWWRRRPCALALVGRVPRAREAALFALVPDETLAGEIRSAVLEVLSRDREAAVPEEWLAWLRSREGRVETHGMDEAILPARARVGDTRVVRALATLASDPWSHRRMLAADAFDALLARVGRGAVLAELGASDLPDLAFEGRRAEDRCLGVRWLHRDGGDPSPALADACVFVAREACDLLSDGSGADDEALLARVERGRVGALRSVRLEPPTGDAGACLWSLAILARRGHDVRATWEALGRPRVPLEVPEDVRTAIVTAFAPGERDSDPRFVLEAAVGGGTLRDERPIVDRAVRALAEAGLSPGEPKSAGDVYRQGDGTYYDVDFAGGTVSISILGAFASAPESDVARRALASAGFRVVDAALASTRFDGLCVYCFGRRGPLTVGELLFYWQD